MAGCVPRNGSAEPVPTAPRPLTSESATAGAADDTLRWAISEPDAIVPPLATVPHALLVVDAVFDSLTAWGLHSQAVGSAASSWTARDGGRTWTFKLRAGATFHDGSPVTASDFRFAWELAVAAGGVGHLLRDVVGYEAVRDGQAERMAGLTTPHPLLLTVRLTQPRGDLPLLVAHPALGPVAQDLWEADARAYQRRPVGNGPFEVPEDWAQGQFIRVQRTEGMDGEITAGPVPVGEVLFRIADPDTAYVAFQQGRVDVTAVPAGALGDAVTAYGRSVDGYRGPGVLDGPTPSLYYLGAGVTVPPFDDPAVRRAVSLAIDRQTLAGDVLEGAAAPADAALPPALPGHQPGTCAACTHDPEQARALFADRGITQLTLWFNAEGGHDVVARRLREDLEAVGVQVDFRNPGLEAYLGAIRGGQAGLFRFGWTADTLSAPDFLTALLDGPTPPAAGEWGANYGRYDAPEVDALLAAARASRVPAVRREQSVRAERLALDRDQAIIPLFTYNHRTVVGERVRGLVLGPMGDANLAEARLLP